MIVQEATFSERPKIHKNSIIELLRFVMAFSILFFHSYFPFPTKYFDVGSWAVSVDFFFVLGGYLLFSSLQRLQDLSLKQKLGKILGKKLQKLGLLFVIASGLALWEAIYLTMSEPNITNMAYFFGYLWFIFVEIIAIILVICLVSLVKNKKIIILLGLLFFVGGYAYFMNFPPPYYRTPTLGYQINFVRSQEPIGYVLRGMGSLFGGYLLGMLPKINLKVLKLLLSILLTITVITLVILPYFPYKEVILLFLFFPLIYFVFQVNFHLPFLDYLGSLSLALYLLQTSAAILSYFRLDAQLVFAFLIIGSVLINAKSLNEFLLTIKNKDFGAFSW
ncbi:MAG: acyltransferase family protein [Acholeplasmatales bacterium]|jgi:hypothetical protein|nr:acyltransferase family protein [Acholeplasmatales bacterium]